MQAVLIKRNADSSVEIIKRGEYPNIEMEPIQGLDPDLEWLLVYKPNIEPEYDPRIYVLQTTESITDVPHPQYPHINQFRVTFLHVKRQPEEIQVAVNQAESLANESLLTYDKRLKILTLGLAVLCRKTSGMTLTQKEQAVFDQVVALGTRIWKNDAQARQLSAEITLGGTPDLDKSWEKE